MEFKSLATRQTFMIQFMIRLSAIETNFKHMWFHLREVFAFDFGYPLGLIWPESGFYFTGKWSMLLRWLWKWQTVCFLTTDTSMGCHRNSYPPNTFQLCHTHLQQYPQLLLAAENVLYRVLDLKWNNMLSICKYVSFKLLVCFMYLNLSLKSARTK